MAEKKEKKLVAASESSAAKKRETITTPSGYTANGAKPVGNAGGLRVGAVILSVVAIIFEVLAVLVLFGKVNITFMPQLWQLIAFIVLDLVCVIIGSQLWKKANHIKPASKQNALKFWLLNNMGVIVSCFAFVPIIILMLTNKDLDKKTKTIAVIAAVIALIIGGAASIDYNPVSQEELTAAEAALGETTVYWSPFGKVYHTHDDCSALNVSETLTYGTVDQAIAENRTRLCKFCAKRDNIENVTTDEQ
jgi:hypothetical protein